VQRFRLKHHVFFKEIPGGTLFDAGRQSFVLKGKNLYPLIGKIVQLMDAGHTVDEIRHGLPEKLRDVFEHVLSALLSHGMLLEGAAEDARAAVPPYALQFYRYLEDNLSSTDCARRFALWRGQTVLVAGRGYSLKAALNVLVESAVGSVCVASPAGLGQERAELNDVLLRHGRVEGRDYRWLPKHGNLPWPSCDLLLYVADDFDAALAQRCAFHSQATEAACLLAGCRGGHAFVLPPGPMSPDALDANLHLLPAAPAAEEGGAHSPASLSLMGCVAAHSALRHHFEIRREALARHIVTVSPWLEVVEHALVLSVAAPEAPAIPVSIQLPPDRPLSAYELLRLAAAPWFDPLLGRFKTDVGKTLRQIPLFHEAISVRFPAATASAPALRLAIGWGLNAEEAGRRALADAFRICAEAELPGASLDVGFEFDEWHAAALASAIVRSAAFGTQAQTVGFDPAALSGARARLLIKLLRLYQPQPLRIRMHFLPRLPAFYAECFGGGVLLASTHGAKASAVIEDAIGQACSRWQIEGSGVAYPPLAALPIRVEQDLADPDAWLADLPIIEPALIDALGARVELWTGAGLPPGACCGRLLLSGAIPHG
jgi:hypothetical protein